MSKYNASRKQCGLMEQAWQQNSLIYNTIKTTMPRVANFDVCNSLQAFVADCGCSAINGRYYLRSCPHFAYWYHTLVIKEFIMKFSAGKFWLRFKEDWCLFAAGTVWLKDKDEKKNIFCFGFSLFSAKVRLFFFFGILALMGFLHVDLYDTWCCN